MSSQYEKYIANFRQFIIRKNKTINARINTEKGLKLYRDIYYPHINVNFTNVKLSSIGKNRYTSGKDISQNVENISKLKDYFSIFKRGCKEGRIIKITDLVFWSEILNTSIDTMLGIKSKNSDVLKNVDYFHYYIPDKKIAPLIKKFSSTLEDLSKKFRYRSKIVWPLIIDCLTGSIMYVSFEVDLNNKTIVKYFMTYNIYSKLHAIIFGPSTQNKTLSKKIMLEEEYLNSKEKFIETATKVYASHRKNIRGSMSNLREFYPNTYKAITDLSDYLLMTLMLEDDETDNEIEI